MSLFVESRYAFVFGSFHGDQYETVSPALLNACTVALTNSPYSSVFGRLTQGDAQLATFEAQHGKDPSNCTVTGSPRARAREILFVRLVKSYSEASSCGTAGGVQVLRYAGFSIKFQTANALMF